LPRSTVEVHACAKKPGNAHKKEPANSAAPDCAELKWIWGAPRGGVCFSVQITALLGNAANGSGRARRRAETVACGHNFLDARNGKIAGLVVKRPTTAQAACSS
jgi:hypothetical protein